MAQNENEFGEEYTETPEGEQRQPEKDWRAEYFKAQEKNKQAVEKAKKDAFDQAKTTIEKDSAASNLAKELGYEKLGARFRKDNPDAEVTKDALKSFLTDELGLEVKEEAEGEQKAEGEQPAAGKPKQEPQQIGTGNVAGFHQGGGAPTGQKRYTGAEALAAYNRGEISVEDFTRALDEGSITKGDPGYVVHKQPG